MDMIMMKKMDRAKINSFAKSLRLHNYQYKNSAEVDIAPAFGEITTSCNVGQAKNGSWCLLEE